MYDERLGRLTDAELVPKIPARPRDEVKQELEEIRAARRRGGRGRAQRSTLPSPLEASP